MKTLDEVIEAMTNEICLNSKADCWEVPVNLYGVIIHYLHKYRSEKKLWEADRKMWAEKGSEIEKKQDKLIKAAKDFQKAKAEMEDISADYVALKQWWAEQNPPLTWDELKGMEGKPIWIELLGNGHWKGWDVVGGFTDDDFGASMVTVRMDDYYKSDLGKTWNAYRRERE